METITITNERFQQALAWMNGQASTLGENEVLEILRSLTGRFQENCRALRPGPVALFRNLHVKPHPLSLSAIYAETEERIIKEEAERPIPATDENPFLKELMEDTPSVTPVEPTPEQQVMDTVAEESRLDSAVLLNSISCVASMSGFTLTMSKAQLILYCLYGCRLGAGFERIPIEHPQVWKYGPVFPRAYKRSHIDDTDACAKSYQELMETDPVLLAALTHKTHSMMATPMADLNAVHKSPQSPYGVTRAQSPDKWGAQIPDELIGEFFEDKMSRKLTGETDKYSSPVK